MNIPSIGTRTFASETVSAPAAFANVSVTPGTIAGGSSAPCTTCGSYGVTAMPVSQIAASRYVYAVGRLEARFPSLGVEKEFAQFATQTQRKGLDEPAFIRAVLADPGAQYLARQLSWVLVSQDRDAFVVVPRDREDLTMFIEAFVSSKEGAVTVIVGRSALNTGWAVDAAEPGLPRFGVDQLIHTDIDEFVKRVPRPKDLPEKDFADCTRAVFSRILRRADNTGLSDDHRALNYVALRYPATYEVATRAVAKSMMIAGIDATPQVAPDGRRLVRLRFSFRGTSNGLIERYSCRVDVTEEFPFIVSTLQQVFDE